jgi:hypothetical protein
MSVTTGFSEKRYSLDERQTETAFESGAVVLIFEVFSVTHWELSPSLERSHDPNGGQVQAICRS